MATRTSVASKWEAYKPRVVALAIGLIAGPIITSVAGWQVTSGSARAQLQAGIVEQLASVCAARARADVADPSKLEWSARSKLAEKWAIMPGSAIADAGVADACSSKLAG